MFSASASEPLPVTFPPWGVYVLESHHSQQFRMQTTHHDFLKIIYVLQGAGHLESDDARHTMRKDDLFIVPCRYGHRIVDSPGKPLELIVLSIQPSAVERFAATSSVFTACQRLRQQMLTSQARNMLRQLLFEQTLQKASCGLMMVGLSLQILAILQRHEGLSLETAHMRYDEETLAGERVKAYIEHLKHHFYEDETLSSVVDKLGISRRYFTQLFKEYTGMSWLAYVRQLRIDHAKTLLRNSHLNVTTIAFECGFNDLSNFYRCFRKAEGISPERWRQQL